MRIGGEFRAKQWPDLRRRLAAGDETAWTEAVDVLKARIEGRYLQQARQLVGRQYSGFAVLAIDCAAIEAIEQFRQGVRETPRKKSGEYFTVFLTATRLKRFFRAQTAELFYSTIRCGILHQGETKSDSLVKRKSARFVVRRSRTGGGIVVNAMRFHEEIEGAFQDYVSALLRGDAGLRAAFIKKMGYVAKTEPEIVDVV